MRAVVKKVSPFYQECDIKIDELSLQSIIPLAHFAQSHRLERAMSLTRLLLKQKIDVYEPVLIRNVNSYQIVMPPLVEVTAGGMHLIDGTHRILAARQQLLDRVMVIAIFGSLPPLPCDPSDWNAIRIVDDAKPLDEILRPLRRELFRPATSYFNGNAFKFLSKSELLEECRREIGGEEVG